MSALAARVEYADAEPDAALLVARRTGGDLIHARFDELGEYLREGDLLVVNNSATLAAALPARVNGEAIDLHLSTPLSEGGWLVELRTTDRRPLRSPPPGTRVELAGGAHATLLGRYRTSERLSVADLRLGAPLTDYLGRHGRPIRYAHADVERPIGDYQTVFARLPGSAEMPSAGRPFTTGLVADLAARGVLIAPITLHCGVSSLEHGEAPYPERYRVPESTARLVNAVHAWRGRVIAVGTTVVRALETVSTRGGLMRPGAGWTDLVVSPERGLHVVDGLVTGWHEPESSHLQLLEAVAGPDLLERSYRVARGHGYRWHEFGDSHLILP
jgi:S-adenosylmethionine:tRNA ribosyltransferase-isomerase